MQRAIVSLGLFLAACVAPAHHSGLDDESDVVRIEGRIERVDWTNPHVRLVLVTAQNERWEVEGTSANVLERWHVERTLFVLGETIQVAGSVPRFDAHAMIGATAVLADDVEVVLQPAVAARLGLADTGVTGLFPPPADAPAGQERGIFRVWTPRGRPGRPTVTLTEAAREAAASRDVRADDPALGCDPPGMPGMLDTIYPIEFVDRGDTLLMRFEEWDGERTIYMDPLKPPPVQDPSPKGVSFGRWAGNTLEIFTLYIDYPYFDALGTPQSTAVTVFERYMPNDTFTRLDWEISVTDPATFVAPVVRSGYLAFEPGERIKVFNCTLPR